MSAISNFYGVVRYNLTVANVSDDRDASIF
jgi:hypothetical protein